MGKASGATSWLDKANNIHIRVYTVGEGGKITERCWDGSGPWYTGAFTNENVSATSAPTATSWVDGNGAHVRVYVPKASDITEYCWDVNRTWYKGAFVE